jgi:hypothetical protein
MKASEIDWRTRRPRIEATFEEREAVRKLFDDGESVIGPHVLERIAGARVAGGGKAIAADIAEPFLARLQRSEDAWLTSRPFRALEWSGSAHVWLFGRPFNAHELSLHYQGEHDGRTVASNPLATLRRLHEARDAAAFRAYAAAVGTWHSMRNRAGEVLAIAQLEVDP